jgi:hypothetical protein
LQFVWNVMAICQQHFGNPFAMFWQSVSSRRGPIYRTRVHEYPEIILRIYAVGITIRIISTYQTIWIGLKNGHDEAAPMPYVLFVAIHLCNKWILRIVRCHIFCTINKWYGVCVGVFIYVHLRCLLCE